MNNQPGSVEAWIDARIGVAGDMLLGACLAVGADLASVQRSVESATGGTVSIGSREERRGSLAATRALVTQLDPLASARHRNLADITSLIRAAGLAAPVEESAVAVFTSIAAAEAQCHGSRIDEVHFHEVGGWDTIADVVGVLAAWHDLGWPAATASAIGVGAGVVATEHGALSVPAPAVAELLIRAGAPTMAGPLRLEAATPTGAALVAHLCEGRWGEQPAMTATRSGYGAGSADPTEAANVTRLILGTPLPSAAGTDPACEELVELTCNVDDLDPRAWPSVVEAALAQGALDCWHVGVTMKHGRPARQVFVLCRPEDATRLRQLLFTHTTTLGVRWRSTSRQVLDRRFVEVVVQGQPIAVKIGESDGVRTVAQPEWRDVERAARVLGQPARVVLAYAQAAALKASGDPRHSP